MDEIKFDGGPGPAKLEQLAEEAKELQAKKVAVWEYYIGLDEVWLDYSTHNGAPYDFNWRCERCGTRNDEGAEVDENYYAILECEKCGAEFRIIDPR